MKQSGVKIIKSNRKTSKLSLSRNQQKIMNKRISSKKFDMKIAMQNKKVIMERMIKNHVIEFDILRLP